ncbi:hypothetical protein ACQCVP_02475 [Rossellomorea vietnamensis]|uniref:hypothetical protein n=1 Tax=Rossellomorea vietnamensis TaxID=218284 RepID=UPI003CF3244B
MSWNFNEQKRKRPGQPRQANVPERKKAVFLLFSQGYLTPRGWALKLDEQKRKRPGQPRQANVPERKKGGFPFILSGLFDPEGLGAEAG